MPSTQQDAGRRDLPAGGGELILYRLEQIEKNTRQLVSLPIYKIEQAAVHSRLDRLELERQAGKTARRALWTGATVALVAPSFTLILKLAGGL